MDRDQGDHRQVTERAHALIQAGRAADAVRMLEPVLAGAPDDAGPWLIHATATRIEQRLEDAVRSARRAVANAPDWADAQAELALVLAAAGFDREATDHAEQAVALAPTNLWCLHTAWYVHLTGRRPAVAADQARRAVDRAPSAPGPHRDLGVALLATGRPGEAEAALRRSLELEPGDSGTLRSLAQTLEAQRPKELALNPEAAARRAEAMELYATALAIDPGDRTARRRLTLLHREHRRLRSNRLLVPVALAGTVLMALAGWNAHPVAGVAAPALTLGMFAAVAALRRRATAPLTERTVSTAEAARSAPPPTPGMTLGQKATLFAVLGQIVLIVAVLRVASAGPDAAPPTVGVVALSALYVLLAAVAVVAQHRIEPAPRESPPGPSMLLIQGLLTAVGGGILLAGSIGRDLAPSAMAVSAGALGAGSVLIGLGVALLVRARRLRRRRFLQPRGDR